LIYKYLTIFLKSNLGEKNEIPLYRTTSIDSDRDLQQTPLNSARVEYDRHSLSSLDDITQPVSYHPPVQTNRDQQHIATVIENISFCTKIRFDIEKQKITHIMCIKKKKS
jgi:hypothetical protein